MSLNEILNITGSIVLLASGIITVIRPQVLAKLTSLPIAQNPRGAAELRTNFGGFFTGIALASLVINTPEAYQVVGVGWLATAIARAIAFAVDRPRLDLTFILLFGGEILMALFMLV